MWVNCRIEVNDDVSQAKVEPTFFPPVYEGSYWDWTDSYLVTKSLAKALSAIYPPPRYSIRAWVARP